MRRIRPSLLPKKAFQADLFSDSSFECPPLVLSLVTACFTKKKNITRRLASFLFSVRLEPARDVISWFFPRRHHRKDHRRQPSPGWLVCAKLAAPRRTAEAATNLLTTILVGFAMHGVQHVSRRPVAGFVLRTSFQQDRCHSFSARDPPAGSVVCRTYDIHLDQRARVLFNFKKTKGHGVLASLLSPATVPAKNSDAPLAPR